MSDDAVLHSRTGALLTSPPQIQISLIISLNLTNCTTTFPLFLSAPILQNCPPAASIPTILGWRFHQPQTRQSKVIGKSVI